MSIHPSPNPPPHAFGSSDVVQATVDAFVDLLVLPILGFKSGGATVTNAGGTNGLSYEVLASRDGGATYPITVQASANVAAGASASIEWVDKVYTHVKIRVKAQTPAAQTTARGSILAA